MIGLDMEDDDRTRKQNPKTATEVTGCCGKEFAPKECPIHWNQYNKVVQCHCCGHIYTPFKYSKD